MYMEVKIEKEKGSNRMVKYNSRLIRDNKNKISKYLNISTSSNGSARVAEWLLQSLDTRCPSGLAGSIPAPGAPNFSSNLIKLNLNKKC